MACSREVMNTFRKRFTLSKTKQHEMRAWYPKHMEGSLKSMQAKLRSVDGIIEVHDARIPLTGRNPLFYQQLYAIKPHVLVMNKSDLINPHLIDPMEQNLRKQDPKLRNVVWATMKNKPYVYAIELIDMLLKDMAAVPRYLRDQTTEYNVMVIGIPNVGKSSLINALRSEFVKRKQGTRVGKIPGITKSVMNKIRVNDEPKMYILDTPGILFPRMDNTEMMLKMTLCHTIAQTRVDSLVLADYLLYLCNRMGEFAYCQHLGLDQPSDVIQEVLIPAAVNRNIRRIQTQPDGSKVLMPCMYGAADLFVDLYRTGKLGRFMLDEEVLKTAS